MHYPQHTEYGAMFGFVKAGIYCNLSFQREGRMRNRRVRKRWMSLHLTMYLLLAFHTHLHDLFSFPRYLKILKHFKEHLNTFLLDFQIVHILVFHFTTYTGGPLLFYFVFSQYHYELRFKKNLNRQPKFTNYWKEDTIKQQAQGQYYNIGLLH